MIPQTLELQVYGARGALGRFIAAPYPDAALARDGAILPLSVTSALVGVFGTRCRRWTSGATPG